MKEEDLLEVVRELNDTIHISQDGGSADLSKMDDGFIKEVEKVYKVSLKSPVFFFNRLIVNEKKRGSGIGTEIMNKLVEILNKKKITVVNQVNTYSPKDHDKKIEFYKKFGFKVISEEVMIRKPK